MDYQAYKKEFLESLRNDSAINGTDTEDEFLNRTLSLLVDYDEVNDPVRFGMGDKRGRGNRLMRADGYCFDETDHSLILFISDFQDSENAANLTRSRVDELYWRLYYFLDEVCNGRMEDYFDDSDDILRIARMFRKRMTCNIDDPQLILKIKFYVLTNKELDTALLDANLLETTIRKKKGAAKKTRTTKKIKKADFNGKPLEINLWYPERFYEMEMTNSNEPVVIDIPKDFSEVGVHGIPCIKGDIGENLGYEAYIAIIPGKLLAEIYIAYGSKVLEGNVRAFLGTSGSKSVNNGIKRTINNDATKFFTYNNGIATTAKGVEVENINGQNLITKIVDFQIINGGQTTATLADAVLKKTNVELEGIYVPMKLTVIEDRETENEDGVRFYDEMVQAIARYANSQNKVTAADLFSNDPFHIWMEKMSKKCLAPPARYTIPTGWYYERSRKKYQQEQVKLRGDELRRFQKKFPKDQVITKEQLGMYLTTVAKILSKIPDGYSLNWNAIWQKQALSPAFMHEIEIVTKQTNDFICDSHGMIVTEYCKKESTWEDYKADKTYTPSAAFMDELVPVSLIKEEETSAKKEAKESNDLKVVMGVVALGPGYWSKLMDAGIRRSMLSYQEQTLLKQVVQLSSTGNIPVSASGKVPYKTMNMIRSVLSIKEKLESEGISVTNGENV